MLSFLRGKKNTEKQETSEKRASNEQLGKSSAVSSELQTRTTLAISDYRQKCMERHVEQSKKVIAKITKCLKRQFLPKRPTLFAKHVDLRFSLRKLWLKDEQFEAVASSFLKTAHCHIVVLDISCNYFTNRSLIILQELLRDEKCFPLLSAINISQNLFTTAAISGLQEICKKRFSSCSIRNSSQQVSFDDNKFTDSWRIKEEECENIISDVNNLPDLDASTVLSETALESHNSECASAIISLSPSTHQLSPISVKDQLFHSLSPIHDITNGNISILRVSDLLEGPGDSTLVKPSPLLSMATMELKQNPLEMQPERQENIAQSSQTSINKQVNLQRRVSLKKPESKRTKIRSSSVVVHTSISQESVIQSEEETKKKKLRLLNMSNIPMYESSICDLSECEFHMKMVPSSENSLKPFMLHDLQYLRHLTSISLSDINLSGELSIRFPNNLKKLNISKNQLTSIAQATFASLSNLIVLSIRSNVIRSIANLTPYCPQLQQLDLSNNLFKSLQGIEHLHQLHVLDVSGNPIITISSLRLLSLNRSLSHISLENTPLIWNDNEKYQQVKLFLKSLLPRLLSINRSTVNQNAYTKSPAIISSLLSNQQKLSPQVSSSHITHSSTKKQIAQQSSSKSIGQRFSSIQASWSMKQHLHTPVLHLDLIPAGKKQNTSIRNGTRSSLAAGRINLTNQDVMQSRMTEVQEVDRSKQNIVNTFDETEETTEVVRMLTEQIVSRLSQADMLNTHIPIRMLTAGICNDVMASMSPKQFLVREDVSTLDTSKISSFQPNWVTEQEKQEEQREQLLANLQLKDMLVNELMREVKKRNCISGENMENAPDTNMVKNWNTVVEEKETMHTEPNRKGILQDSGPFCSKHNFASKKEDSCLGTPLITAVPIEVKQLLDSLIETVIHHQNFLSREQISFKEHL